MKQCASRTSRYQICKATHNEQGLLHHGPLEFPYLIFISSCEDDTTTRPKMDGHRQDNATCLDAAMDY